MADTPTPRPDGETRQRLAEAFARHRNPDLHGIGRNADIVVMPGEYAECYALADVALAEVASLTEDLAATRAEIAELKSDEWSERLFEQRDQAIRERDETIKKFTAHVDCDRTNDAVQKQLYKERDRANRERDEARVEAAAANRYAEQQEQRMAAMRADHEAEIADMQADLERVEAERDALLRLRDKAVFWRESLSLVRQIDASDEELVLADALGTPIRILTQPTEEAGK